MKISVTLFLPGGNATLKFDGCSEVSATADSIEFVNRQGAKVESNLPYVIARESELAN